MLYRFKSRATSDLVMLEADANIILGILGKEPAAKGIIPAQSLPQAMAALERAVAVEPRSTVVTPEADVDNPAADCDADRLRDQDEADAVSLKQRAWAMLNMMRRARDQDVDIVWGV